MSATQNNTDASAAADKTARHSPLPWSYSAIIGDNHVMSKPLHTSIARVPCDADREFIVRACNNVERLADELEKLLPLVESLVLDGEPYFDIQESARAALAEWESSAR